ncbi:RNA polymerase-binding protein DksA [Helicobacter cappadocius]|uniref:RNA polymerase-binding protein DksA n=1 Tax=Helicobacter cappadocius TaxID=3063998 RepID=A0AA90SSG9_9HELI|nr:MULTISPECIES: RNA polymerase-binding protein DksA [unclassified Helicobacter]MDO7252806.1 RNA polymerase-binding protein DksA [Helicobacter sp. faydin-H75]MDP2538849.1 RNA polymerase-binding protein DksA [Helicobacter sp. faydin-H76]
MKKETLKYFEQILKDRINEISSNIDMRNISLKELNNSNLKDQSDIVSANLQGQLDFLIIQKHGLELQDIMSSLQKIKNETYGICEMCDDEIDIERLKIKPHAKYCIKCRELHEKSKNRGEK